MRCCRKSMLWLLMALLIFCFNLVVRASYDPTSSILAKVQGKWYDSEGNVVLDFQGNTVNGCAIVGA